MGRKNKKHSSFREDAIFRETMRRKAMTDGIGYLEENKKLLENKGYKVDPKAIERDNALIAKRVRGQFRPSRRTLALALAAALIIVSTLSAFAFWDEINHFWIDLKNNLAGFGPAFSTGQSIQWSAYHSPAYLPPGFQYVNGYEVENGVIRFYRNDEGVEFTLRELSDGTSSTLDGDNGERQQLVRVNGAEAVLSLGKTVTLTWGSSPVFVLQGPLDYGELLRIAESIPIIGTYPENTRYE